MKILYIDLPSGISGDMTLAAFLDAGVPESVLREGLARFGLDGYELTVEPGQKGGISGKHVNVMLTGGADAGCDHPGSEHHEHHGHYEHHEHHEHQGHHEQDHSTDEHAGHNHHVQDHAGHGYLAHQHTAVEGHESSGGHVHRNWNDIRGMIAESALLEDEKSLATRIFQRIADAEGHVHGKPADEVGFHEVGAVDSIVDIVGAAICFHWLKPDQVTASPVNTGSGFVRCAHGLLPVPAPATAAILSAAHVPMYAKGSPGERTTPTGAAILAEFVHFFGLMPPMTVSSIGYGIGTKDFDAPNILRMMVGETDAFGSNIRSSGETDAPGSNIRSSGDSDQIVMLEANLDDMTGEAAGYLMALLMEAGARDVFYTPVFMKKNRPGMLLTVLAACDMASLMESLIFKESSTIGIRRVSAARTIMNREQLTVYVEGHPVSVKVCSWKDISKAAPEYESVREVALKTGLPFRKVYQMAEAAYALLPGESAP